MQRITQLEAVNTIISVVGEAPLNSLANALTSDSAVALRLLTELARDVQTNGWAFNTDIDFVLARDGSNNIFVPDNLLRFEFDRNYYTNVFPVLRNRQLYDQKNQTYTFKNDIKMKKVVWLMNFDDVPETMKRYLTVKAGRVFADRQGGGQEVHAYTEEQEREAKKNLDRDQSLQRKLNIFSADGTSNVLNRMAPWAW